MSVPVQLTVDEYDEEECTTIDGTGEAVKHILARSAVEEHSDAENAEIGFNLVPKGVGKSTSPDLGSSVSCFSIGALSGKFSIAIISL
mmetsp:Transcript_21497/g.30785  ORF Transcript_21497/g.30785 Transcript_21497/m.30785 type:complete len:88 (+) Transcript_21497:208-471(+)